MVAARLAEDSNVSVLLLEAGQHNELLENTKMVGGYVRPDIVNQILLLYFSDPS